MGVYYPDMKMPNCCYECDMCYDNFYCKHLEVSFYHESDREFVPEGFNPEVERLPGCKAVYIPPHGRLLLDKHVLETFGDAILDEAKKTGCVRATFNEVATVVADVPTIIPAEDG